MTWRDVYTRKDQEIPMKERFRFFKTALIGGLVFLIPIFVLVFIAGKVLAIAKRVAAPMAEALPFGPLLDLVVGNLIAITLVLVVCFLAGLIAKKAFAKRIMGTLENRLLSKLPPYTLIKNISKSMMGLEEAEGLRPVLAEFDDATQIAFEVEQTEEGQVVVFIPGSPNSWSGDVFIMERSRVKTLKVPLAEAKRCVSHVGKGAGRLLTMKEG
jgi:uncharacterized membrane protein